MTQRFDYFVLFAEMRTGSNFLEANLNLYPDVSCMGEVFNPVFIGYPNTDEVLGFDQVARDANPLGLVEAIRKQNGVAGFRFFHDHHPGILDEVLSDPRCAKIILTRNPVDSYVSRKIAAATGQWKLTNPTRQKSSQIDFDREEFELHMSNLQSFQVRVLNALQKTGQTAFYIAYEDIQDLDIMNGLARFLGSETELTTLSKNLKKQNPAPMSAKVTNFEEMQASLAAFDQFNLTRTPNFEPRRGPQVPSYVAAARAPLLYMPISAGPDARVTQWLADLDGADLLDLLRNFGQKSLRQWKRQNRLHRGFTVVRHPVARAYRAFEDRIVGAGKGSFPAIRNKLMRVYGVPLAEDGPGDDWGTAEQKAAFLGYLSFLRMNLSGQTAVRVDGAWATQVSVIQGFAEFAIPDIIIREDTLEEDLSRLCDRVGVEMVSLPAEREGPIPLAAIYDEEIEAAVKDAYQRDYVSFGFGPWEGTI
ncbi:MAG: sulfotransferase family 2 domain-containing protein [Pseudomonadota bacterium]